MYTLLGCLIISDSAPGIAPRATAGTKNLQIVKKERNSAPGPAESNCARFHIRTQSHGRGRRAWLRLSQRVDESWQAQRTGVTMCTQQPMHPTPRACSRSVSCLCAPS